MDHDPKKEGIRKVVDEISLKAMREGRIVQVGWLAFRAVCIARDAPEYVLEAQRNAYFNGAQHLFATLMGPALGDDTPAAAELANENMTKISNELEEYVKEFELKFLRAKGGKG